MFLIAGINPPFKLVVDTQLRASVEASHPPATLTLTLLTLHTPTLTTTTLERNARRGHPLSVMTATMTYKSSATITPLAPLNQEPRLQLMKGEILIDSHTPTWVKDYHQVTTMYIEKLEFGHQKLLIFVDSTAKPPLKIGAITMSRRGTILIDTDRAVIQCMLERSSFL